MTTATAATTAAAAGISAVSRKAETGSLPFFQKEEETKKPSFAVHLTHTPTTKPAIAAKS